jgi:hypothetical protein
MRPMRHGALCGVKLLRKMRIESAGKSAVKIFGLRIERFLYGVAAEHFSRSRVEPYT